MDSYCFFESGVEGVGASLLAAWTRVLASVYVFFGVCASLLAAMPHTECLCKRFSAQGRKHVSACPRTHEARALALAAARAR
eukprot:2908593-Pleurochrysis_carterae.AAC.2